MAGRSMLRQELTTRMSSSTAARVMEDVRLYALLIAEAPAPFSTRARVQLWMSMRVMARISQPSQ